MSLPSPGGFSAGSSLGSFILATHRDLETLKSQVDQLQSSGNAVPPALLTSLRSTLAAAEQNFRSNASQVLQSPGETRQPLAATMARLDAEMLKSRKLRDVQRPVLERMKERHERESLTRPALPVGQAALNRRFRLGLGERKKGKEEEKTNKQKTAKTTNLPPLNTRSVELAESLASVSFSLGSSALPLQSSRVRLYHHQEQFSRANRFVQLHHAGMPKLDISKEVMDYEAQFRRENPELAKLGGLEENRMVHVPQKNLIDLPIYDPYDNAASEPTFFTEASGATTLIVRDSAAPASSAPGTSTALVSLEPPPSPPPSNFLVISKGRFIRSSLTFQNFYRQYNFILPVVDRSLQALEGICRLHHIKAASVDCERLVELFEKARAAEQRPSRCSPVTNRDYLKCFVVGDSVGGAPHRARHELLRKIPGMKFLHFQNDDDKRDYAATCIQSRIRGFLARRSYFLWKIRHYSSKKIQRAWRNSRKLQETRRKIDEIFYQKYHQWNRNIQQPWKQLFVEKEAMGNSRSSASYPPAAAAEASGPPNKLVLIHLSSLALPSSHRSSLLHLNIQENLSLLARLTDCRDFPSRFPGQSIEILFISPYRLNEEIKQYCMKFLQIGDSGVIPVSQSSGRNSSSSSSSSSSRLSIEFLVPENSQRFSEYNFPLSTVLFYSPRTMQAIRSYLNGKSGLLMPNCMNLHDLRLCMEFSIPLYGLSTPELMKKAIFYNKSYVKSILQQTAGNSEEETAMATTNAADGFSSSSSAAQRNSEEEEEDDAEAHYPENPLPPITVPIGVHDLFSFDDLIHYFSKLLMNHLFISKWVFKINCGNSSYPWGLARFSIGNLFPPGGGGGGEGENQSGKFSSSSSSSSSSSTHHPLNIFLHRLRLDSLIHSIQFHQMETIKENTEKLMELLKRYLYQRIDIISYNHHYSSSSTGPERKKKGGNSFSSSSFSSSSTRQWSSVEEYFQCFYQSGGVIEAFPSSILSCPTVNGLIEPSGKIRILSSHERIYSTNQEKADGSCVVKIGNSAPLAILESPQSSFYPIGSSFPCIKTPTDLLHGTAESVGRICFKQGIIGYFSVDFLYFLDNHIVNPYLAYESMDNPSSSSLPSSSSSPFSPLFSSSFPSVEIRPDQESFAQQFSGYFKFAHSQVNSALHQTAFGVKKTAMPTLAPSLGSSNGTIYSPQLWVSDVNFSPSPSLAAFRVFHFLMKGEYQYRQNDQTGQEAHYKVPIDRSARGNTPSSALSSASPYRSFTCFPSLFHPQLSSLQFQSFFHTARLGGLSLDVGGKLGTAFLLVDSFASATLGILTIQETPGKSLEAMRAALKFLESFIASIRQSFGNSLLKDEETLFPASRAIKAALKRMALEEKFPTLRSRK